MTVLPSNSQPRTGKGVILAAKARTSGIRESIERVSVAWGVPPSKASFAVLLTRLQAEVIIKAVDVLQYTGRNQSTGIGGREIIIVL